MQPTYDIAIRELILIVLFLGSPVFFLGVLFQVLYVHFRLLFSWMSAIMGAALALMLSIFLTPIVWLKIGRTMGEQLFMIFGVINLPALLSTCCIVPLVIWLQLVSIRYRTHKQ